MAAEREKMFECEVRRRRVKEGGGYEPYWKVKNVAVALVDEDTDFRCKDCFGAVKVLGKNGKNGTVPYVEHKLAADAEFCPSGLQFKKATDGREPRPSEHPVA
jgi:Na+-translocating ferredoxin:NAD+ oxidoreductase RNF subunit RnfB